MADDPQSLGDFTLDLTRFGELTQLRANTVFRKVGFDLFQGIVYRTPVDTGRCRGNWMLELNAVPIGEREGTDKIGNNTVADGNFNLAPATTEDEIFIGNNTPYVIELEYGHSKQAPAGMVRVTIAEFGGIVQKAVVEEGGTP